MTPVVDKTAHTPGPWEWGDDCIVNDEGVLVTHVAGANEADMTLMIAAPELVDALRADDIDSIVEGIEHFIMNGDPEGDRLWQPYINKLNALRAAIAKAEGR